MPTKLSILRQIWCHCQLIFINILCTSYQTHRYFQMREQVAVSTFNSRAYQFPAKVNRTCTERENLSLNSDFVCPMDQEFFAILPPELIINILSRLPIKTIIHSKCVSKSWYQLLQTPEFTNSHLSITLPGLIVFKCEESPGGDDWLTIFEFVDDLGLDRHELHYKPVTEIDSKIFISPVYHGWSLDGSVNGLLFLRDTNTKPYTIYICNPITREFIDLPKLGDHTSPTFMNYAFGVSKTSCQYKVVRILYEGIHDPDTYRLLSIPYAECQIYTIGTGSWRSIAPDYSHNYNFRPHGSFFNGNLHWLVVDLKGTPLISCFNLDTEHFSTLSSPTHFPGRIRLLGSVMVLEDQLCVCDNNSENENVIWIMKEYGVEKSWEKTFVMSKVPEFGHDGYEIVYPLKVFRDGDILMMWDDFNLIYYCNKTKSTAQLLDLFDTQFMSFTQAWLHVPSFVSLKSFVMESVRSF